MAPPDSPPEVSNQSLPPLRRLTALGRAFGYASSLDDILDVARKGCEELLCTERAAIILASPAGEYDLREWYGFTPQTPAVALKPATIAPQLSEWLGAARQTVPLLAGSRLLGVLGVTWSDGEASEHEEREWLLSTFADQLAMAIDAARREALVVAKDQALHKTEQREEGQRLALGTLTHDVRSPLTTISLQIEMLNSEMLGPLADKQKEALQRIGRAVTQIADLATLVLETERFLASPGEMTPAQVVVADLVTRCVEQVEALCQTKALRISVEVDPALCFHAEPEWSLRILSNLIDNAIKYTPSGGNISVVGHPADDGLVTLIVSDTGPGIPSDAAETIFEPYTRAPNTANVTKGLGLGLSLARALAHRMGGTLTLDTHVQVGACLVLRLPAAAPDSDRA